MIKKYYLKNLNQDSLKKLCHRKAISFKAVLPIVKDVLEKVKKSGDPSISDFSQKFDKTSLKSFKASKKEIDDASNRIPQQVQKAFQKAAENIEKFHKSQLTQTKSIKTMEGVNCFSQTRAIEKVGLYIPGGTAPLPSTVLMLAIPAKIAECREIVLVSPPNQQGGIDDIILFSAKLCGINQIFKIGGAQAIAALAYGTQTVPKVYKIFGPGNQYVTAAKMLVSTDPEGSAIDMPAGPTEVLVIADDLAKNEFVASDLLSQAEHGDDSQAILITTSQKKADEILNQLKTQLSALPRKKIAQKALENSFVIIASSIDKAIEFSNQYAPEHLILNVKKPQKYIPKIINAGSVFLGQYSCEAAGDYASGTNHALPTYGYAKVYEGVNVKSFQKQITFQQITKKGAQNLGPIVAKMAQQEGLEGHKQAMELRYKK
ncbi:MAG: histidinol dehydrogenase [Candidatus Moranbacteria bacterium]|nr:histidinol dehydrogenase [Candidatus Moranbacteria bacterium]